MDLIGKESISYEDIVEDMHVFIDKETASLLQVEFEKCFEQNFVKTEYEVLEGKYKVVKIDNSFSNPKNIPPKARVAATIFLKHELSQCEVPVVINELGDIILAGALLIENSIKPYFTKTKELTRINDKRHKCIACENILNIISANLRICKECEEVLEKNI